MNFPVSGIFTTVSLFVFGFKVAEEVQDMDVQDWALSWSFSLSCTACILIQIAASVLVSESKRMSCTETMTVKDNGLEDEMVLPVTLPDYQMDNDNEDDLMANDSKVLLYDVATS